MSGGHADLILTPFGWPVVIYMTLAGISAGAALTSCWLLWKAEEGWHRLARHGLLLSAAGIFFGSLFLIADLEAPSRFWMILVYFNPASWISWGVRIITLFGMLSLFTWLLLHRGGATNGELPTSLKLTTGLIAFLGLAIGLYPAWVLMQSVARPLWGSPLIAPLFLASAVHTGLAALVLIQVMGGSERREAPGGRRLEGVLVVVQALLLGLYVLFLTSGGYDAAAARLLHGELAPWLWVGVILLGWLIPLATTLGSAAGSGRLLLRAVCVLVGGLALRTWIIFGGQGADALISTLR